MVSNVPPPISIVDPRVLAIPIIENNEPLYDLKDQTLITYGPSPEIANNLDYTKVRRSVYERLVQAQTLLPMGLKLCVYEGYRSLSLQKQLFEKYFLKIQQLHPEWPHDTVFTESTKLVSPLVNEDGSENIPPHSTGGAVDLYLIDKDGNTIPMGIALKDWADDREGVLSLTASSRISGEAQNYRKIMKDALETAGFVNYPTEYWHWSYGDRYWAYHTGHPYAHYNVIARRAK